MNIGELKSVARAIVAKPKGLLAADESGPTIKKRFDSIKVESTEETGEDIVSCFSLPRASNAISAASSCTMKRCARVRVTASPSPNCYRAGESFPASRWTKVQRRWPSIQEIKLLKVWMDCVIVSPNTDSLARDSRVAGRDRGGRA